MTTKTTPWFDGMQKPTRVGAYQRNYGDKDRQSICFSWWNGEFFGFGDSTAEIAELAASHGGQRSGSQNLPWRGVLK